MLSFPLNFAIYCGMSAQFRNTFKALFDYSGLFGRGDNGVQSATAAAEAAVDNTVSLAIVGDGASVAPIRRMSSAIAAKVTRSAKQKNGNLFAS